MNKNIEMIDIVKTMLLEAELKDIFSTISGSDKLYITLLNGKKHVYQVESNIGGKIIMKDVAPKALGVNYVMSRESLNGTDLTIHQYDGKAASNDFKGKEIKLEVSKMSTINTKTGSKEDIDVEGNEDDFNREELNSRVDEYNQIIKKLDKGDTLRITTDNKGEEEGDDSIVNDLFFGVLGVTKNWYIVSLDNISGNVEGNEAIPTKKLVNAVGNANLFIGKEGFFKVIDNLVTLVITFGKNVRIPITGIIDVDINNLEKKDDFDDDDKKYSKDELLDWLKNRDEYNELINKTPNFWEKLRGASPKGLFQLKKMLQQTGVDNSYLTKGDKVKFKLLSNDINIDLSHKLSNGAGKFYGATVIKSNVLKKGNIGQGHWEFKLLEETDKSTYKAEVTFCKSDRTCKIVDKNATIKIVDNG